MFHVGIDAHHKYSSICIVSDEGEVVSRGDVRSREEDLHRFLDGFEDLRIVLECSSSSPWIARVLKERGHEVTVVNARRVRLIAESTLKTDQVDAEVLAQLSCFGRGLLRGVFQRSDEATLLRTRLGVRTALVRCKVALMNSVKGTLRATGHRVQGVSVGRFLSNYGSAALPAELRRALDPLIETLFELSARIEQLTGGLAEDSKKSALCQRLQSVPGVGPIVSLSYIGWMDDPGRFRRSREVGGYAGLRPRIRDSGGTQRRGGISREGDPEMRRLLVQAAHSMMRARKDSALKQWGAGLAERIGKKRATVALARKIAVLLHHLWTTGQSFEPFPNAA